LTKPQLKFTIEVNEGTPGGKEALVFRKVPFYRPLYFSHRIVFILQWIILKAISKEDMVVSFHVTLAQGIPNTR
jgi:hypothetical protein